MARHPRFVPPGTLVEITSRTNGARLYLRPSPELNAAILGILGRALARYPVALHAFVFLSNHWHALVTPADGAALADFLRYVHGNVAKAAQEHNRIKGTVWQRRAQVIPVLDEIAQLGRLRYVLSHGTKEHLVASPLDWPGVTAARALAGRETLVGAWVDRTRRKRLERSGRTPHASEYTTEYPIELTPLPVHERQSDAQRVCEVRTMIAEIEAAHPGPHLGVAAVLAQDPNAEPRDSKRSRAPAVHTASDDLKINYLFLRAEFRAAYRRAATRHAERPTTVGWPLDSFLPASTFISVGRSPPLLAMLAFDHFERRSA